MPSGKIKCSKCSRSFSMAAHLARHMYTTHGAARKSGRPAGQAKRGRPVTHTAHAHSNGMPDIVNQMQSIRSDLLSRRDAIDHQINTLDTAMNAFGHDGSTVRSSRPKVRVARMNVGRIGRPAGAVGRPGSLKNMVVKILSGKSIPMSPNQISDAVKKAGYKTKSKDLTKAVSNVLPDIRSVKRVGFGKYAM